MKRAATAALVASRLRSHSHGPGWISSKSLMAKIRLRSAEAGHRPAPDPGLARHLPRLGEVEGRQFYVRQLADMKGSVKFSEHDKANLRGFVEYCGLCGWALALAHAKSGDPAMIAGYCGSSAALDEAIAAFAIAYAKQTERDHAALKLAERSGRIEVVHEKAA
jgi:hypothetical protein